MITGSGNGNARSLFVKRLLNLGAVVWVGTPGGVGGPEFYRPKGWQSLDPSGNDDRLKAFQEGRDCLAVNTGIPIAVVDADPQNGADIAKVRQLLADLNVVILAEIDTPGGGKHWYVLGHPDLPTTHSTADNQKLPDYPGVDIQSHRANVFLPGTLRPKYNGGGYRVVSDNLDKYDPSDPAQKAGAEALADWLAQQRATGVKTKTRKASGVWKLSPPWAGGPPDARQLKYLKKAFDGELDKVRKAPPGTRNETLFTAALKLGSYVAGAGLDEQLVITELQKADSRPGATAADVYATNATIRSGLRGGKANPRAVPKNFFAGREGLLALELAEEVMESVTCGYGMPDARHYVYANGVWRPDENCIRSEVARLLGNRHRRVHATTVLELIQYSPDTPTLKDIPLEEFINTPNGMLRWKIGELLPHDPAYLSTVQLPVEYDPWATCPDFEAFIAEVLPPDLVMPTPDFGPGFIWELIGYTMLSGNPLQRAILLFGSGRNGKGTLIRVVKALLGEDNISAVSLHELIGNKFRAADLFRILANLAGDLDSKWLDDTATFKKITGKDLISAEYKYGASFNFTPWALPFYSTNKPFGSADSSEGWHARWVIVPFPNSFDGREDLGLDAKLTTKSELQGIMRRGIEGLQSLMARRRFPAVASLIEAKEAFIVSSDAVRAWVDECCDIDASLWNKRIDLYNHYAMKAGSAGSKPLSAQHFYSRLEQIAGITAAKRRGERGFTGIGIKSRQPSWP